MFHNCFYFYFFPLDYKYNFSNSVGFLKTLLKRKLPFYCSLYYVLIKLSQISPLNIVNNF